MNGYVVVCVRDKSYIIPGATKSDTYSVTLVL